MKSSIEDLRTQVGYYLGCTISQTSRWTQAMVDDMINNAIKKIVSDLYEARCWKLLRELQEEKSYILDGSTSYNVYDVIGGDDYYGFISDGLNTASHIDNSPLYEISIYDEKKLAFSPGVPLICFYGVDTTSKIPVFKIIPHTLTGTLYFRYLKNPPRADESTPCCLPKICDLGIVFLVCAWCWSSDRNSEEFMRFIQLYNNELNGYIRNYSEPFNILGA